MWVSIWAPDSRCVWMNSLVPCSSSDRVGRARVPLPPLPLELEPATWACAAGLCVFPVWAAVCEAVESSPDVRWYTLTARNGCRSGAHCPVNAGASGVEGLPKTPELSVSPASRASAALSGLGTPE